MLTPDAGLKSTPSTFKPSEENAQPHDDELSTHFIMLKNGLVLYFDRVFFVIVNLSGALFLICNSDQ